MRKAHAEYKKSILIHGDKCKILNLKLGQWGRRIFGRSKIQVLLMNKYLDMMLSDNISFFVKYVILKV